MMPVRKLRTIFAATDFSRTADDAVRWGASLAKSHGARLVLHPSVAAPPPPLFSPGLEISTDESQEVKRSHATAKLERIAEELAATGIDVQIDLGGDLGARPLLASALHYDADLLVVGTRGQRRFRRALLGSTASQLVRESPIPVLVVPPGATPAHPIRRVLIPTDLEIDPTRAVEALRDLLGEEAAPLEATLLHVHERLYQPASPWSTPLVVGADSEILSATAQRLEEVAQRLGSAFTRISTVVCSGDAARAIDCEAQSRGADLTVVAHGRAMLSRLFRSSTAERILAESPCPVLSIRLPEGSSPALKRVDREDSLAAPGA
jgi:nucleotide-binding universal stress UspA family protein